MKNFYTTIHYKQKNTHHANKSLEKKLRFKKIKKIKNTQRLGVDQIDKILSVKNGKYNDYVRATVPTNFSFLRNQEEVSKFINLLKIFHNDRRKVFIKMKQVELIDNSAIVVLLSIMIKFKPEKIKFNGDFPVNPKVAKSFKDSGFFETLAISELKNKEKYVLGKQKIYTHAWKHVDAELSKTIMQSISPLIHKQKVVYKGLHRTLVELMQNSYNHATPLKEGDIHWWLSVNVDEKTQVASFSFIDYGVGIFDSLNSKEESSKWYSFKDYFFNKSNSEILKAILEGEVHKTVTGEYFRGKGLPGIKEAMDRNLISNLYVITNNVYADVSNNIFTKLSNTFQGTFVYWEINQYTHHSPWIE